MAPPCLNRVTFFTRRCIYSVHWVCVSLFACTEYYLELSPNFEQHASRENFVEMFRVMELVSQALKIWVLNKLGTLT